MSIALFKNIWNVINGRPPIEGIEIIWETVRDRIIGMLNNHSLYDCLDIWSDNELFRDLVNTPAILRNQANSSTVGMTPTMVAQRSINFNAVEDDLHDFLSSNPD